MLRQSSVSHAVIGTLCIRPHCFICRRRKLIMPWYSILSFNRTRSQGSKESQVVVFFSNKSIYERQIKLIFQWYHDLSLLSMTRVELERRRHQHRDAVTHFAGANQRIVRFFPQHLIISVNSNVSWLIYFRWSHSSIPVSVDSLSYEAEYACADNMALEIMLNGTGLIIPYSPLALRQYSRETSASIWPLLFSTFNICPWRRSLST